MVGLATSLAGCVTDGSDHRPADPTATHHIRVLAVEWKGGTSVDDEPYPGDASFPPGGGYSIDPPNEDGRWQVEVYRWDPGVIIVNEGDTVTLDLFGVNGARHPSTIEGHDVAFEVTRGTFTNVTFTAGAPGTYRIQCHAHAPSMEAMLVVLPHVQR